MPHRVLLSIKGLLALLIVAFLAACSSSIPDVPDDPSNSSGHPITFTALSEWNKTDANTRTTNDGNVTTFTAGDEIGVFAYKNNSASPDFMNNQKVTFDGTKWTYSPIKYWPQNGTDQLTFWGYFPYADNTESSDKQINAENGSGSPIIVYENANADLDLLATKAKKSESINDKYSAVELELKHILSKVNFSFSVNNDKDKPVIHVIKYNIATKGKYDCAKEDSPWSILAQDTLYRETLPNGEVISGGNHQIDRFTAYLIPCSIDKFYISINNNFVKFVPNPIINLVAGKQYNLNFVIAGESSNNVFITSYTLWDSDGVTHEGNLK